MCCCKRNDGAKETVSLSETAIYVRGLLDIIHNEMYAHALKHLKEHTYRVNTYDEFKETLNNHPGFIKAPWCGKTCCEEKKRGNWCNNTLY